VYFGGVAGKECPTKVGGLCRAAGTGSSRGNWGFLSEGRGLKSFGEVGGDSFWRVK